MVRRPLILVTAGMLATAVATACAPVSESGTTATPATGGSGTAAASPACSKDALPLKNPGRLTIGTDKPAYEPWFKDDDPSNGQGFESAVAYAVAGRLGFTRDEVDWITVAFDSAFSPGAKKFDFDINQVSITPDRAKAVDFSDGYYRVKQAVVAVKGSKFASATDLAGLRDATIGVQVGTTSLQAVQDVIRTTEQPKVYNQQVDAVNALKNGQVDAIVVDLPTAFYVTAAQVENSVIVGQFDAASGTPEEFGLVMEKGSGLVTCVNQAIAQVESSGDLRKIETEWLGSAAGAPELK
ncbi:polar amino acid transport system substrate-binding protein [Thermocatellispora tengchongensis]|uniref:Polar amino acid transport system substrate-binding protein n=1 Tax=Thermocatellispora tengchongensis TaxID=1073253 RepID=A0A840NZM6_9ACTN|nr:ABC transporter substrate-binding protein [Thermocatellispora tengchongensis]MBB5130457.1 polar amino acid transport system substrate-binding protein [Thermocatellispora tengchongensis]